MINVESGLRRSYRRNVIDAGTERMRRMMGAEELDFFWECKRRECDLQNDSRSEHCISCSSLRLVITRRADTSSMILSSYLSNSSSGSSSISNSNSNRNSNSNSSMPSDQEELSILCPNCFHIQALTMICVDSALLKWTQCLV